MHAEHIAPVLRLADDLIAAREVQDDRRAQLRKPHARRVGDPRVLADLHAHDDVRRKLDQHVAARVPFPAEAEHAVFGSGRKMPRLIKLGVIRDILLCRQRKQLAAAEHGRAVVQRAARRHRDTDRAEDVQVLRPLDQRPKARLGALHQLPVLEQVAAGIARHRKLREHDDRRAVFRRLRDHPVHLFRVIGAVRHPDGGRGRRDADESVRLPLVFHLLSSSPERPPARKGAGGSFPA